MDGLLFDSERIVQRSWNRAGQELGYGNIGENIYHTLGFNVNRRYEFFKSVYGDDFPMDDFNRITRAAFREIVDQEGLNKMPGVDELLALAKEKGLKLAVASSSRRAYAMNNLTEGGIIQYFDGCVFGDMVTKAKPDPEIYLKACELLGVDPEDAAAVEDAPSGVEAAFRAGMKVIMIPDLVKPEKKTRELLWKEYGSLKEVSDLLREIL